MIIYNKPTTLAISVGKFCSPRILPLPTPVQCWRNTFHVTEVWILLFSNIERGNGAQEVVFVGFWSWFDVFSHFPTQFVQGCLNLKWKVFLKEIESAYKTE